MQLLLLTTALYLLKYERQALLAWFCNIFPKKYSMKKIFTVAAIAMGVLFMTACGNNNANTDTKADSSNVVIPPPDNSSATNPSLADTNFSKNQDSSRLKKDSIK